MNLWRKAAALILSLCLCLPLAGCGYQELAERLLIHGIGVDVGEDGGFLVSVRSSFSTGDEGEEYFTAQGDSVLEALSSLSLATGREPFYSHNYLVVFGRECAEQGLDRCLDFFVRYYNTRPAVQVFLAAGTAEEVLSAQKDGRYWKMSELQEVGGSGRYNGMVPRVELLNFVNGAKRPGSSPLLPVLEVTEDGPRAAGSAYFRGYTLAGFLTLEQTRGCLTLGEGLANGEALVEDGAGGKVTLTLSSGAAKIQADWQPGEAPSFTIQVKAQGDVSAISGGRDRLAGELYAALERQAASLLRGEMESAIRQAVKRDRCDIFGFGNLLYQCFPDQWRQASGDWPALMAQASYQVEVSAKVLRLEQEVAGAPAGQEMLP